MATDREINEQKLRDSVVQISDVTIDNALLEQMATIIDTILLDTEKVEKQVIRNDIQILLDTPLSKDALIAKLKDLTALLT